MQPIQNSKELRDVTSSLLKDERNLLECYVAISYNRKQKKEGSIILDKNQPLKKSWVYYFEFWRGPFNENPIKTKYYHCTPLEEDDVDKLILRSLLAEDSPYFFDRKLGKIIKLKEFYG